MEIDKFNKFRKLRTWFTAKQAGWFASHFEPFWGFKENMFFLFKLPDSNIPSQTPFQKKTTTQKRHVFDKCLQVTYPPS